MKKNNIFNVILSIFYTILCLALLIFCVPSYVPMHISLNETIVSLCSKWLLFIPICITILFAMLTMFLKNVTFKKFFTAIFAVSVFENLLLFAYFSLETEFVVGMPFKIPMSIIVYFPIAFLIIVWANLLKSVPYKSKFGIRTKYSLETEFLWTQIHFSAKDKFFAAGLILFLISIIFSFFKLAIVELALFVLVIIITYSLVLKDAKMMYRKYHEMKTRKDNLQNKKDKK